MPTEKGNLPYGTYVVLRADSLPKQSYYEYSWDHGKNWIRGDPILLCRSGIISARIRTLNLASQIIKKTLPSITKGF